MATLREVEERDSKGNTTRMNPSVVFKQDPQVRHIVGRNDWRLEDNEDHHQPITAQAQDGKIRFFSGTPESTPSRTAAVELPLDQVPAYIIDTFTKRPMKVREARPTVYEVKIATIGDVEVAQVDEIANDGISVTVSPSVPNLDAPQRGARGAHRAGASV